MIRLKIISIALLGGVLLPNVISAQCATVMGSDGIATDTPSWFSCSGSNELQIETTSAWIDLVIDWGDGSGTQAVGTFISEDAPLVHLYDGNNSNYTVMLSEADGSCSVEGHFTIGMPEGNLTSSATQICQGNSVQFSQAISNVDYTWNFGTNDMYFPTTAGNVSFTFQNPGEYMVESVISIPGLEDVCTDTTSVPVTVLANPVVETTFSATEGCGSATVSAQVSAAESYIYVWTFTPEPMFSSGTTLDPVTFDTPGNHPLSVTVTGWNGCQTSAQEIITVHPEPTAIFAFDAVCQGQPTTFDDQSTAGLNTNITGWHWTFGDGNESYESNPTNDYSFTGDYNVSLVVTTPECSASTSQFVSVHPNPSVEIVSSVETGCSPLEVNFTADGIFANEFAWNIDNNETTGDEVTQTLITALDEEPMHDVTVTATSSQGCTVTESMVIEVLPAAVADFSVAALAGCAPYTPIVTNGSLGATNYEWWLDGALVSSGSNWDTPLTNDGEFISNAAVELIAIAANGCNDAAQQNLQVYPQADFSFELPTDSVCSPLEFTLPSINGSVSHEWNLGNGTTSTEETPNVFYQNTGSGLMGASITYAGISPFGCTDMHTETVYIRPQPVASFSTDETEGCEPLAANFENTTTNADSYIWDFDNGITDDGETASYAFSTTGEVENFTITLTATDDLGCSDVATQTVTVYPAADFNLDLNVPSNCSPVALTLPTYEGLFNFDWNFGDGSSSTENGPTHIWENETNAATASIITLEAETQYGCEGMAVALLQVTPSPSVEFTADIIAGCEPLAVTFLSETALANEFAWDFGNGETSSSENAFQEFVSNGTNSDFEVTLTVTHELGCTDTATETVTAFSAVDVDLAFEVDSACSPLTLTMPDFTGLENVSWNFGDGNTSNEVAPSYTWENNSDELMTATVTFSAQTENGCTGSATADVFVKPQPMADFSTDFDNGCEPLVSQFGNNSSNADAFDWNFGNGNASSEESPSMVFVADEATEAFTVTLIATDDLGCFDTATKTVTVHPGANFSLDLGNDSVCSPLSLDMPAIANAQNISWNFGDGNTSNEVAPSYTWENNSDELMTATVTFSAQTENGCTGSATADVFVKPQPMADFSTDFDNGCEPLVSQFGNNSSNADAFDWNFGNGNASSEESPSMVFVADEATEAFTVTLIATDDLGCFDTATKTVTVHPGANFSLDLGNDSVCSPLSLDMPAIANAQNISWNFGDGNTSNEVAPSYTWENNSDELMTATVTFSAQTENGCTGSATADVFVKPQPMADFSTDFDNGCEPLVSQFGNNSSNADAFDWNFGNGNASSEESPSMVFVADEATEAFTVTLIATDDLGCFDTATKTVTVHPGANFSLDLGNDSVCSPLSLDMPAIANAQNISWNFGDGNTSNEVAPSYTWENNSDELMTATVTFSAQTENGCTGSATADVFVKPQPMANFTASATSGCEPFEATFNNNSTNGDAYIWNFGEDLIPGEFNLAPTVDHAFNATGDDASTFTVTLLAIDALGCTDERSMEIEVFPTPEFNLELTATEACSPLVLTMPEMNAANASYWSFGDGSLSNESTPTHSWSNASMDLATFTINFQGSNAFGCSGSVSTEVNVKPQPVADFTTADDEGCAPFDAVITNMSERADSFVIDFGNESTEANNGFENMLHTFEGEATAMDYTISLTATHALGCSDVQEKVVSVFPAVAATWSGITEGCAPFDAAFMLEASEGVETTWNVSGETFNGSEFNTTFPGVSGAEALHTIAMGVTSSFGCQDSTEIMVTVHPVPELSLSTSTAKTCSEEEWIVFNAAQFADSTALILSNGNAFINPNDSIVLNLENATSEDLIIEMTQVAFTAFGCSSASGLAHTIHPKVTAEFATPEAACTPMEAGFENNSTNATGNIQWSFGDGTESVASNPTHTFATNSTQDTTFTVSLFATSEAGCADSTTAQVIVFGRPVAALSLDNLEGCYPVDATFANHSVGQTSVAWNYGNGEFGATSDSLHTKTFFNPTAELITYTTELSVTNDHNCSAISTVSFDVAPYLNAQFDVVSQGCSPVDGQLINQSEGAASFIWNFNDGSASSNEANPSHVFVNNTNEDQTFEVELIALSAYGCSDTISVGVDVYPMPEASFSVTPAVQTYPNTTVGINNSSLASSSAVQYWSFGDGDEVVGDQPIFHTFDSWGTYNITLLVDNGICADAHTEQINILSPNPVASFIGSGNGCAPLMVEFTNNSNHGAGYVWNFDDDQMTSEESPLHVFTRPGTYNVSLTVIGYEGQEDQVIHYGAVEVFPAATAAFVNSPTEVIVPDQPVEFVNLSDDASIEFLWNFGDGQVSTEPDPIHFYTEPGIYDVTLTANNEFNCPTSYTLEHAVEATTGGFMEFPTAFTPIYGGGNGGAYDPAALDNDIFHPHHTGIVEYELIIFNKWGELIFRSTDVYVGWDGYYEGVLARQDVYAWKASAQFSNGHRVTKAGDVTLIVQ